LSDFIRGLWDGDGTIYYSKINKRSEMYYSAYASGSKDFIEQLYGILKAKIPGLGGCFYKNENVYVISFSINDTIRLKKFMYQKSLGNKLMLKRKYDLFCRAESLRNSRKKEFLNYVDAQNIIAHKSFIAHKSSRRREDWKIYCKSGLKPRNIPFAPDKFYKDKGWIDWPTWFGYLRKRRRSMKFAIKST